MSKLGLTSATTALTMAQDTLNKVTLIVMNYDGWWRMTVVGLRVELQK